MSKQVQLFWKNLENKNCTLLSLLSCGAAFKRVCVRCFVRKTVIMITLVKHRVCAATNCKIELNFAVVSF